jgi:hypothetical protein
MRKLIAVVGLIAAAVVPAFGRIGETSAECIARYGEPLKIDKEAKSLSFLKEEIIVIAYFHESRCDMITLSKVDRTTIPSRDVELSDNEIALLLDSNGGGKKWIEREIISLTRVWETEGGEVFAQYEPSSKLLIIVTKERRARDEAQRRVDEQKKLDGF